MEQIWVYGNSYESTLVAVVVPQQHELMGWAKQNGQGSSFEEVVKSPEVCGGCTSFALHGRSLRYSRHMADRYSPASF